MKHELETYLPMRKACEILGVVPITLRRWEKAGKIQTIRTPSGQRRYARSEILRLLGENQPKGVRAVIYARVSSAKQAGEGNLKRQRQRLEKYVQEKGGKMYIAARDMASILGVSDYDVLARVQAVFRNGTPYVPARDAAAAFGCEIRWNPGTKCAVFG